MSRWRPVVLGCALLAAAAGCGGAGGVPVTGTVTLDGTPLDGAEVTFIPTAQPGVQGSAVTQAGGRFEAATAQGRHGLPPGAYKVTVTKVILPPGHDPNVAFDPATVKNAVPAAYTSAETTPLTATVEAGKTVELALAGKTGSGTGEKKK